jgi:hypothetical protein
MNNDTGLLEPSVDREQIFNESRTNTDLILNTNNDGLISSNTIDRVIQKTSLLGGTTSKNQSNHCEFDARMCVNDHRYLSS